MSVFPPPRWGAMVCVLLSLAAGPAASGQSLLLGDAIDRALAGNPELLAFGHQIDAQRGQVLQSGLRPNLELGVTVENALGTGDLAGIERAETTLSLGWIMERGQRERRVEAARAGVTLLEADADARRMDVAAETARRFLDSLAIQERLTLSDEAVRLATQTVANIRQRVRAGRTPDADLARAEAELARVRLSRDDLGHELRVSIRRLAAQWGESRPDFAGVGGDVRTLPAPEPLAVLLARIDQNPGITRFYSEKRLREAELLLAQAQAKPAWRFDAGVRRLEQTDDQALVAGVTIPLATRNRNQGRIAAARANMAKTDADQAAVRLQIQTQLYALYQELEHSLHRAEVLRQEILPRVEKALLDTQRAYDAGRYDYFELRVVQAEMLNGRTALVEASIDAHRNVLEIERLTGTTLSFSTFPSRESQ